MSSSPGVVVGLSFLGLTQLAADTSYWLLGADPFLMGLGMGFTMMPTFSGAMQTLRRTDVSRASTTLNIEQQVGASIGTAVLLPKTRPERVQEAPGEEPAVAIAMH
jgi:hypothetical protein